MRMEDGSGRLSGHSFSAPPGSLKWGFFPPLPCDWVATLFCRLVRPTPTHPILHLPKLPLFTLSSLASPKDTLLMLKPTSAWDTPKRKNRYWCKLLTKAVPKPKIISPKIDSRMEV